MIIDKNGKLIANVAQPVIIFDSEEDYNTWKDKLPDEEAEDNFTVIKKFAALEYNVETLKKLKAIPSSKKQKDIIYHVDHICGTLKQKVDYTYDPDKDIFVPITTPVWMDGDNYNEFMELMTAEEFKNYNIIFTLYPHYISLLISFTDTPPIAALPFEAGDQIMIGLNFNLPYDKPFDDFNDFIIKYSSIAFRAPGPSIESPLVGRFSSGLLVGSDVRSEKGLAFLPNITTNSHFIGGYFTPGVKWGERIRIEDDLWLSFVPHNTIDWAVMYPYLEYATVELYTDEVPAIGSIYYE